MNIINISGFKDLLNNLAELANGNSSDKNQLQGFSAQKYNYEFDTNNSRTNRAMESLTDRFVETQAADKTKLRLQRDEKYTPKVIIIPLKKGVESVGYKELSRSLIEHTLKENKIEASNMELEVMLDDLTKNQKLDMYEDINADGTRKNKVGRMPAPDTYTDGKGRKVYGYSFNLTPDFQKEIVENHKAVRTELAKPENIGKKAVIEMNVGERLLETLDIAYQKGYIGEEANRQLKSLSAAELITLFGISGAVGAAGTTEIGGAVLGPVGIVLGGAVAMEKIMEFTKTTDKIVAATNRKELEQPARELGAWIGSLPKNALIAIVGMGGGISGIKAKRAFPKAVNTIKQNIPQLEEAVMITQDGTAVRGIRVKPKVDEVPDNVQLSKGKTQETDSLGRRDLDSHEGVSGVREGKQVGHAVLKHVGKSERWLQNRLVRETNTPSASSFHNETVGNRTVGRFVKENREAIDQWLKDKTTRPFKAEIDMKEDIGLVIYRNKKGTPLPAEKATKAEIILVKNNSEHGWHLFTVKLQK